MNRGEQNLMKSTKSYIKKYKYLILALLVSIVLFVVIIVSAYKIISSRGTKKSDVVVDDITCKKIRRDFIQTLRKTYKVGVLNFKFDENMTQGEMGLINEDFGRQFVVVNSASSDLLPGKSGLNGGIARWVKSKDGIDGDKWKNLKTIKNGNFEDENWEDENQESSVADGMYRSISAVSQFKYGYIFHITAPKASSIGAENGFKDLTDLKKAINALYSDILRLAKRMEAKFIILPIFSEGFNCDMKKNQNFKKSEFLTAIYSGITDFIKEINENYIKIFINVSLD